MQYDIYYINSAGEKLDFCKWPYMIFDGDILDYDWSYDSSANYGAAGGKIKNFTKSVGNKKLNVTIFGRSEIVYRKAVDTLADTVEYDVANITPGKLYVNGSYIECYIKGIKASDWISSCDYLDVELVIAVEYPFWLMDREYIFKKTEQISVNNYRYPLRYPFRYPNGKTNGIIYQRHIKPCDFILSINGPAQDPSVSIGGKIYGIKGELLESEYIVIDSRKGYVRKYINNSGKDIYVNMYDNRLRNNNDIYSKLERGTLPVEWTGEFTFSLRVIEERSLPRWNL